MNVIKFEFLNYAAFGAVNGPYVLHTPSLLLTVRMLSRYGACISLLHEGTMHPGGVHGISSDGDNRAKSQDPKKYLALPEKPKKNPGPKFKPQKIPCRFCGP